MKALNDMEEARATAFQRFRELAERDDDFTEHEQAEYDRLLAEIQDLGEKCRQWHRIPQKSGRRF